MEIHGQDKQNPSVLTCGRLLGSSPQTAFLSHWGVSVRS